MQTEFFRKLGLTKNEESIYLFLLSHGSRVASNIGKRLNIKRVTAYAALESLEKKDLIISFKENAITYYESVSPERLLKLCKGRIEKEEELYHNAKKLLPTLDKLKDNQVTPNLEIKGKISYYQGLEAVRGLIDETLDEGSKEQLCFGLNSYHIEHIKDDWKDYTQRRVGIGMNVRSIQPNIKAAKDYKKRDKDELRKTRLVPKDKFPGYSELNIIGDMITLFNTRGSEPVGVKINNKDLAQALTSLFNLAWEKADDYKKQ